jgi:hypothetical protein
MITGGQDVIIILPFSLEKQNRQLSGPVRAEDENSFYVSGSAGSGNQRNKAGIIRRVFPFQEGKRFGQVGNELGRSREDDMVRWKDGERAATSASVRYQDAPGLSD